MPSRPLRRISESGPVKCLTCGAPTHSSPKVAINRPIRPNRACMSAGSASNSLSTVSFRVSTRQVVSPPIVADGFTGAFPFTGLNLDETADISYEGEPQGGMGTLPASQSRIMKRWLPSVAVIAAALIAIIAIWWPEYFARSYGIACEFWREVATLVVLGFVGLLLACRWCTLMHDKRTREPSANDTAVATELDPPYPDVRVWQSITGFRYESHLKLMRLRDGLENIDREAQYIVAEDYKVSFKLDGERRCITVQRGTLTDLASVPRMFRILVGRVGPHLEASIIHDYQYMVWQRMDLSPNERMRRFADELMLVAMNAASMGCKARLIYWAVRMFGCRAFFGKGPEPLILAEEQFPRCCHGGARGE